MRPDEFWRSCPAELALMVEAEQQRHDHQRLLAAISAEWHQYAANRAIGAALGGNVGWLEKWDLVPDLMPDSLREQRRRAEEQANELKWQIVSGWLKPRDQQGQGH